MIPYEELCSALARWRERQGLANGPSAVPPQGAILTPPPPAAVAPAPPAPEAAAADSGDLVFAASISSGFGDSVPTEEHPADPPTTITRSPYAPEGEAETIIQDEDDLDAPTGLHLTPEEIAPGRDVTNELDIDDLGDAGDDEPKPN
jgi:hypothetical protein